MNYVENRDIFHTRGFSKQIEDFSAITVDQDIDGGTFPFSVSFYEHTYFMTLKEAINLRIKLDAEISAFQVAEALKFRSEI